MQFEITENEKKVFNHISALLNICSACEYCPESHEGTLSDEEYNDLLKDDVVKALDTLATKIGRRVLAQEFNVEV